MGRTGLRLGIDAKRGKYFSVGLPGSGPSYCSFFGRPLTPETIREVAYTVMAAAIILGVWAILSIQDG